MADREAVIAVLESLIETCKDGETGYVHAAGVVKDERLKEWFGAQSRERHHFLQELKEEVTRLGESDPDTSGSVAGTLHRAWFETKADVGASDESIISSVETGEKSAADSYQKALQAGLPENIRAIVGRQAERVFSALNRLREIYGGRAA
jgi:uncharacterized protein (TIGR02284 family)